DYPETLFQLTYPCEGDPELATNIVSMLNERGHAAKLDDSAGLDHGAWIPLYVAFPNVDIPVVQISIPGHASPQTVLEMGRTLRDLRKKGILMIGSGNIANNKHLADLEHKYAETDAWAIEFDEWFAKNLNDLNIDKLINFETDAPHAEKAVANKSHILPLYFVLGALQQNDYYVNLHEGFHFGNISMRSFALSSNQ
ncbi:MAG: dioxygenase family protein, partial [Candidatus Kariarchaeaceae archaeon]